MLAHFGLERDSDLLTDQLRAIDNKRLVEGPLLELDQAMMQRLDEALREIMNRLP